MSEWVGLVSVAISLVALGGAVFIVRGYVRGSELKGLDQADDRLIEHQRERIELLESDNRDLKAKVEDLTREVSRISGRNEVLESLYRFDTVPKSFLEALEASANAHHAQTLRAVTKIIEHDSQETRKVIADALVSVGTAFREGMAEFTERMDRIYPSEWDGSERRDGGAD